MIGDGCIVCAYCIGYETSDVVLVVVAFALVVDVFGDEFVVFPLLLLLIVLELAPFNVAGTTDTTFCVGIACVTNFGTCVAAVY